MKTETEIETEKFNSVNWLKKYKNLKNDCHNWVRSARAIGSIWTLSSSKFQYWVLNQTNHPELRVHVCRVRVLLRRTRVQEDRDSSPSIGVSSSVSSRFRCDIYFTETYYVT